MTNEVDVIRMGRVGAGPRSRERASVTSVELFEVVYLENVEGVIGYFVGREAGVE